MLKAFSVERNLPQRKSTKIFRYINIGAGTIDSANTVYQIPIHLFVINNDSGTPPIGASGIGAQIYNAIAQANTFFDNGMSFYLCDITYINNSQYYNSGSLSALYSFVHILQGYPDNAITLVYNNANTLPSATLPSTPTE